MEDAVGRPRGGAPEDAYAAMAEGLLREPDVEAGTGFGKIPGLRSGGKIFAMLVDGALVVKLPAECAQALISTGKARAFHVGKRRMRQWVAVEDGHADEWPALTREALDYVRSASAGVS